MSQNIPEETPAEKTPEKRSSNIDWFQFTIAMVVVVSFTIFEGMVIWGNPKFDEAFQIISMTAPFVGTIIGFYFGQRPVQNLTKEVASITSTNQSFRSSSLEAGEIIENDDKTIQDLKADIKVLKGTIEKLKSQKGVQ